MSEPLEMYVFRCRDCEFLYAEPFNPMSSSMYPPCDNCGSNNIEVFDGDLPDAIEKSIEKYNRENDIF